jgi:hypothetical protein
MPRATRRTLLLLTLLAIRAGQAGASPATPPQAALAPVAALARQPELHPEAIDDDPSADRHWASATALTQPAGSIQLTDHMGLLVGITVGVTDAVQVFANGAVLGAETTFFSGGAKVAFDRHGRWRAAGFARASALVQQYTNTWITEAGGVVSYCLHSGCRSLLSTSASIYDYQVTGSTDDGGGTQEVLWSWSVGLSHALLRYLKLTSEVNLFRDPDRFTNPAAALSARLHGPSWALELSAVLAVERFFKADPNVDVLPWIAGAYRWR